MEVERGSDSGDLSGPSHPLELGSSSSSFLGVGLSWFGLLGRLGVPACSGARAVGSAWRLAPEGMGVVLAQRTP